MAERPRGLQTADWRQYLEREASFFPLMLVVLSGLALGCHAALTFAADFKFGPVEPSTSGVVGWVTLHRYSKTREIVYYAVCTGLATLLPALCVGTWIAFSRFVARAAAVPVGRVLALDAWTYVPAFAGLLGALADWRHSGRLLAATAAAILIAKTPIVAMFSGDARERPLDSPADGAPNTDGPALRLRAPDWLPDVAAILFAGGVFGLFLPLAASLDWAAMLARGWWLWPLLFLAIAWMSRGVGETRAESLARQALACTPAFLILGAPYLVDAPLARRFLAAVVVVLLLALRLRRAPLAAGTERRQLLTRIAQAVAVTLLGAACGFSPSMPGGHIHPLDGDHNFSWIEDAFHGRLPYRDFWYPYGPLLYGLELLSAQVSGLARYHVAELTLAGGLLALVLWGTARSAFLSWPVQVLGSCYLFLNIPGGSQGPRLLLAYAAVVSALVRFEKGKSLAVAGVLAAVSFLYSPEAAIAALVAVVATLGMRSLVTRHGGIRLLPALRSLAIGFVAALGPALLVGGLAGALPGYLHSLALARVADECCGSPFPSFFLSLPTAPAAFLAPRAFLGFLTGDLWRYFYLPPLLYVVAALYLASRVVRGRHVPHDTVLLGIVAFGALLFRSALARSDEGHVAHAAFPSLVLCAALLERIGLRFVAGPRARDRLLSAVAISFLLVSFRLPESLSSKLFEAVAWLRDSHLFYVSPTGEEMPGLSPVRGRDGGLYYFAEGAHARVKGVTEYLAERLSPNEGIYAFPFTFRYNFLLGRACPLRFGPSLWNAAAAPVDRRRLVAEMAAQPPRYVVYDESEWPDADLVPWTDRFPEVFEFIARHYVVETQIAEALVLRHEPNAALALPPRVLEVSGPEARLFLLTGWYYPSDQGGREARRTTPHATARMARGAQDAELFVELLPSDVRPRRELAVSIDGRLIGRATVSASGGWQTLAFPLPDGVRVGTPLDVSLDFDSPYPSNDLLEAGVAVSRLGLR